MHRLLGYTAAGARAERPDVVLLETWIVFKFVASDARA